MLQAFVIVLREGFEAFLIVSVIVSYLQRTNRRHLLPPVRWGVLVSVGLSWALGRLLVHRGFDPLWEGILGLVAVVLVSTLVIQMWTHARYLKQETEQQLETLSSRASLSWAALGVFGFTALMVAREGVETALLLVQIQDRAFVMGVWGGLACMILLAVLWVKCSRLVNLRLFFQVTSVFLLLFLGQILIYALHELSEAGLLPHSEAFHAATEPFSPDGLYGKWFSVVTLVFCFGWFLIAWGRQRRHRPRVSSHP